MTQAGAEVFHVNTQLDMMRLTGTFHNFANVHKNATVHSYK